MDHSKYQVGQKVCKILQKSLNELFGQPHGGSVVKNPPAKAGDIRDAGLIPGSGRSPGGGKGNPLQYSCLENPMERGTWRAAEHGVHGVHARTWGGKELDTTQAT